jgi:monoamine oxidase
VTAAAPSTHFLIVGAGAAGLIAARELARAGKRVTVLEARDRCGGRIWSLPTEEWGYPAEGGAEFVHGTATVTRAVMRDAGLSLQRRTGTRWSTGTGALSRDEPSSPHWDRFYRALEIVTLDLPVAEFLKTHFAAPEYEALRRAVRRTVEGYDAADPARFSTLALRDEWLARDDGEHGRIEGGYGALIGYLARECRRQGAAIHLGALVIAIEETPRGIAARCRDGTTVEADAAILSVPPPILSEIALPASASERAASIADIGYGNVIKILLRFRSRWWTEQGGRDLTDLSFLLSDATVPTWWTQYPAEYPVLTGWYAGPKADRVPNLTDAELVEMGLASLAEIFDLPAGRLRGDVLTARAINWGNDPFARGAYSYATPESRAAQSALTSPNGARVFFAGEALYAGPDMGTVEAALASGLETARMIVGADGQSAGKGTLGKGELR